MIFVIKSFLLKIVIPDTYKKYFTWSNPLELST